MTPKTYVDLVKRQIQQADYHLFTSIDRLFGVWSEFWTHHPDRAGDVARLMHTIEACRFMLCQFYTEQWGGNPGWLLRSPEVGERLREQRVEWIKEAAKCQESLTD